MFSKDKGTTASIVSVIVFVGCCAAMVADFNLWWLPICALPFLLFSNIGYKGHWESDAVDEAAEKAQEDEPNTKTWPFSVLEAEPADSKRQELRNKEIRKERKALERVEEDTRLRQIRAQAPRDVVRREETDREMRKERHDLEAIQQDAALQRIRDQYR